MHLEYCEEELKQSRLDCTCVTAGPWEHRLADPWQDLATWKLGRRRFREGWGGGGGGDHRLEDAYWGAATSGKNDNWCIDWFGLCYGKKIHTDMYL